MSGHVPLSGGRSVWTSDVERAERAALNAAWLRYYREAVRFGSADPGAVADVLTYGIEQRTGGG